MAFDWTAALDTVGRGRHDLVGVEAVRAACDALGVAQPPLHLHEAEEVRRLRASAASLLAKAERIELRPADYVP